jgi:hypothetical protein
VETISITSETKIPELATKNVPGSISTLIFLPVLELKSSTNFNALPASSLTSVS